MKKREVGRVVFLNLISIVVSLGVVALVFCVAVIDGDAFAVLTGQAAVNR